MSDTSTASADPAAAPGSGGDVPAARPQAPVNAGPGRLLLGFYSLFTVAAASRSAVQICTDFDRAPLAYVLSAVAAVVYGVITVCLLRGGRTARRLALASCLVELVGVVAVGLLTVLDGDAFPDATVWSDFGIGYLFIPILLPVSGLLWLRRAGRTPPSPADPDAADSADADPRS